VFFFDLARDLFGKVALAGWDTMLVGDLGDVGCFNTAYAMPGFLKIRDQRAVEHFSGFSA
jgi:hypothetical protein